MIPCHGGCAGQKNLSDEESDVKKAMELGANAYRVKSCDFNELARLVEELRVTCLDEAQTVEHQPSR